MSNNSTIKDLLIKTEVRLALAQGLDVQVHAEDRILQILRHKYEMLFDQFWWDDLLINETFDIDPATNAVIGDLTDKIKDFNDIHSVFINENPRRLPFLNVGRNPTQWKMQGIIPFPTNPTKVFKVLPSYTGDIVHVWYRTRLSNDVWEDGQYETPIPMDDQMLILGACYDFLVDDGTNPESAKKFQQLFDMRVSQQAGMQHQHPLSKSDDASQIPTDWYYTNGT